MPKINCITTSRDGTHASVFLKIHPLISVCSQVWGPISWIRGSQSVVFRSAASASSGNLLETQILISLFRPTEPETLGWDPAICSLTSPPGDYDVHSSLLFLLHNMILGFSILAVFTFLARCFFVVGVCPMPCLPGLYLWTLVSPFPTPPPSDNLKYPQILPNIPCGRNHPLLRPLPDKHLWRYSHLAALRIPWGTSKNTDA